MTLDPTAVPPHEDLERLLAQAVEAAERGDRAEVERLCAEHPQHADAIRRHLHRLGKLGLMTAEEAPRQIGPYRILEVLGEGGMGTVYLAEQRQPVRRRVALKVIKLGMDTKQVLARFEAERQALAMMNHDHIAKVFEAGTTERGQPYFVMEHVPGLPITEHCDKHKLTIKERLALFQQVCAGVQHAHQKGVIHRDLKPGNVLVTVDQGKAVPKIIDFGLARATDHRLVEATLFTEQGQIVGTPEYMSPEQAEMTSQDIDTRTDVYSLGVLLYELLVGQLPFSARELRAAGLLEIQRKIREDDPPKPSTRLTSLGDGSAEAAQRRRTQVGALARELRGDLDWIVMRSMEKDRNRRYESAGSFSADVERYLAHEPVEASPPSTAYRLRKLLYRNRVAVTIVAAVLLSLAIGLVVSWRLYLQAESSAEEAHKQEGMAQQEREVARRENYAAQFFAAQMAFDRHDLEKARGFLHKCPQELRQFEWGRLMLAYADKSSSAWGERVAFVGFGATDDTVLFQQLGNKHLQATNIQTGVVSPVVELGDYYRSPGSYFLNANRTRLLTASWGRLAERDRLKAQSDRRVMADITKTPCPVQVWDLESRRLIQTIQLDGNLREILACDRDLQRVVATEHLQRVVATDGRMATVVACHLWDLQTNRSTLRFDNRIELAAFSPDSKALVTYSGQDVYEKSRQAQGGVLQVWDVDTGRMVRSNPFQSNPAVLEWSPNGEFIALGTADAAVILAAEDLSEWHICGDHADRVVETAFSPDSRYLLTGEERGDLRVWDTETGELVSLLRAARRCNDVSWSPSGRRIASGHFDGARVWDPWDGLIRHGLIGHWKAINSISFAPDGLEFATASLDQTVRVWSRVTGDCQYVIRLMEAVDAVAFASDGGRIAIGCPDGTVHIWNCAERAIVSRVSTGAPLTPPELPGNKTVWIRDGQHLVTAHKDGAVRVVDMEDGRIRHVLDNGGGAVLALSADPSRPRIASASENGTLRLWNVATGNLVVEMATPRVVYSLAYSLDGVHLASALKDGSVLLWDAESGTRTGTLLPIHKQWGPCDVAFSTDARRVLMLGSSVHVWDRATQDILWQSPIPRQSLSPFVGRRVPGDPRGAVWAPDGSCAVVADQIIESDSKMAESFLRFQVARRGVRPRVYRLLQEHGSSDLVSRALSSVEELTAEEVAAALDVANDEFELAMIPRVVEMLLELEQEGAFLKEEKIAAVGRDDSLSPALKALASLEAEAQNDWSKAVGWNTEAWEIVRDRGRAAGDYQRAIKIALAATRVRPGDGSLLNTLAVALCRAQRHGDALETLRRSDKLNGGVPSDVAFLAMTLHKLGQTEEADAEHARLLELMKDPKHAYDEENQNFLREVEELFGK